jgi:hypothetical protein
VGELTWRKSSRSTSNGGACVEVARIPAGAPDAGRIAARDSKHPDGPQLRFHAGDWQSFLARVKAGDHTR